MQNKTTQAKELEHLSNKGRLKRPKKSLGKKHLRRGMIEVYKIMHAIGKIDIIFSPFLIILQFSGIQYISLAKDSELTK